MKLKDLVPLLCNDFQLHDLKGKWIGWSGDWERYAEYGVNNIDVIQDDYDFMITLDMMLVDDEDNEERLGLFEHEGYMVSEPWDV